MELEYHIQLLNTTLDIGHADLTTVDADVLVCPVNIYFSSSEGVARAINQKAGVAIGLEVRKHSLPAKLGTVIVTGAGQLPARYIFHVVIGNYLDKAPQDVLTAHLIKEILTLATLLNIQHIALPLIGSGAAGGDKAIALDCILNAALHYITNNPTSIRQISIAIFEGIAHDHLAETVRSKNAAIQAIQTLMLKLQDLRNSLTDDSELQSMLDLRLQTYQDQLSQLFFFAAIDSPKDFLAINVISPQAKHDTRKRIKETLQELTEALKHETAIQKIEQFHLRDHEKNAARKGLATESHIKLQITELQRQMEQRSYKITQLEIQRDAYTNALKRLI